MDKYKTLLNNALTLLHKAERISPYAFDEDLTDIIEALKALATEVEE
jgi:hypothetical protein